MRIFIILILAVAGIFHHKVAFSHDFNQVIEAFERDFQRIDPIRMRGRFESVVQEITGMDIRKDVEIVYKTRGDVKEEAFSQDLKRKGLLDEIECNGLEFILKQLHVMEKGHSLKDILRDYGELDGFYNPTTKQIVIIEDTDKQVTAEILLHELVHVAQDTTIELDAYLEKHFETIDSSLAASALLEGQAVAVRLLIGVERNLMDRSRKEILTSYIDRLDQAEDPFQQNVFDLINGLKYFPYTFGQYFFLHQYVKQDQGFAAMLEKVPVSTEQVMHPDKFAKKELPVTPPLQREKNPFSPLGGTKPFYNTTLGEYFMTKIVSPAVASEANTGTCGIKGWGGDRIFVFEGSNSPFFVWDTVWDSADDAKRFYECYVSFTKNRYKTKDMPPFDSFTAALKKENNCVYLKLNGTRLTIIEGNISPDMTGPLNEVLAHDS